MELLFTVCARAGSKGVKSKNIRPFLGYPICCYTLSAYRLFLQRYAKEYSGAVLAVNTDSQELFKQVSDTGTEYLAVQRKEELAGDSASKIDVIRDTLKEAQRVTGRVFDAVVDMDLTSPLRKVEDIKNVVDALLNSDGADIALSVTEPRRNPYFNQLSLRDNGFYGPVIQSDFTARQQAPEIFDANASLYAYSPAYLTNSDKIFLKANLAVSVMQDTAVLDIDSERDYELMQVAARYFYETDPGFGEIRDNIATFAKRQSDLQ